MSMHFNAGCYAMGRNEKAELIRGVYLLGLKYGFEYRAGRGYPAALDLQLQRMLRNEDDFFWLRSDDRSLLVGLPPVQQSPNNQTSEGVHVFSLSFDYAHITTKEPSIGQLFLEKVLEFLTDIYTFLNSDLTWAGYPEDTPDTGAYQNSKVTDLFWFNIIGSRFVNAIGKEKLLSAPGWQIRPMSDGSVIVRLSEHPDIYKKIDGVYLHEYLRLSYVG